MKLFLKATVTVINTATDKNEQRISHVQNSQNQVSNRPYLLLSKCNVLERYSRIYVAMRCFKQNTVASELKVS